MSRLARILGLVAICAAVQGGPAIDAQSASANLQVTASVSKNCTITTSPVNFGAYDPITAHKTSNLDGQGTLTVTCTRGAGAKVALAAGANALGTVRRMQDGAASYLTYELYQDSSRSTPWGEGTSAKDLATALNSSPRDFVVYGRVPSGQDAAVGNYNDTVVATVNF